MHQPINRGRHVDDYLFVCSDEAQRQLRIVLIVLHRIWQTNCDELGRVADITQPFDGKLCEPARKRRILPT